MNIIKSFKIFLSHPVWWKVVVDSIKNSFVMMAQSCWYNLQNKSGPKVEPCGTPLVTVKNF